MILTKHLMDPVEDSDGTRLWIEPIGLTRDLVQWCRVDDLLLDLAPPTRLREWFDQHPDGYSYFRAEYHLHLASSKHRRALEELAGAGLRQNLTLLHQGDDPSHNSATALYEHLSELQAYCKNEE